MAFGTALGLATTSVLTYKYGPGGFAIFTLIVSLLSALPFADLGLGAAVVNASADLHRGTLSYTTYASIVLRFVRILSAIAALVVLLSALAWVTGIFPTIFGLLLDDQDQLMIMATLTCLAVSIPMGLGVRILYGFERTKQVTQLSFVGTVVQGLALVVTWSLGLGASSFSLGPAVGLVAVNLVTLVVAMRATSRYRRPSAGADAQRAADLSDVDLKRRSILTDDYNLASTAAPYLLITIAYAVSNQYGRIILSNVSDINSVAGYGFVSQFSVPIASVITLASINLWGVYRGQIGSGELSTRAFALQVGLFAILGMAGALALIAAIYITAPFVLHGQIVIDLSVPLAAGASLVAWSAIRPSTMIMNDARGLWPQAAWAVAAALANLSMSIPLSAAIGAAGPFVALTLATFFFQLLPYSALARRRIGISHLAVND